MARLLTPLLLPLTLALGAVVVAGCGAGAGSSDPGGEIDNGFESDDPSGKKDDTSSLGSSSGGSADAGSGAPVSGEANGSDSAARTVEEADILQQEGNRLYALSRTGGLSIVDISDPDHMKIVGRKRTDGTPFEMYVKSGRVYLMLNAFGRYVQENGNPYGRWVDSSELVAFDTTNPAAITELTHYDVPGTIADSRIVGDVLYLITFEDGYCWGCGQNPATNVTSFGIANGTIAKVEQLTYASTDKNYSSWQRSVTATDKRLYIAGPEWNWTPTSTDAHSVIQVVDITDPAGHLVKGADVPVAGQVNSRWQMDEYNGVLRVISQFGNGWYSPTGSTNPEVQTFTVTSSSTITPLAHTDIVLPAEETLQSVRFDGTRGYAITSRNTDPLFTIDLTDPAHPVQAGQVTLPGSIIYMEPKGDRLVGFGYANGSSSNGFAATLFDVTDLTKPSLIKQVTFGSGWGSFAEDQDRIQKSVRILDDQGLVLVPFASYGNWDGTGCSKPQSGIQLIDYSRDNLTLRGVAPQYGMPRRALLANNRLLAVSDRNITSFDIASRDAPAKTGQVDLSNPAYQIVETANHIATITNDWWSGEVMFSLTPKNAPDDANAVGKISLAALADTNETYCGYAASGAWASWYDARIFANGNFVYVTVPVYSYASNTRSGKVVIASIDISNPAQPVISGKSEMKLTDHDYGSYGGYYPYFYDGWWDGYWYWNYWGGQAGALVGSGEAIVQIGSKLAYLETDFEPYQTTQADGTIRWNSKVHRKLHVADFAAANAPVVHDGIDLGDSLGSAPLLVQNGVVLTTRWIKSNRTANKVRFFADRVDLNGATPTHLPSINTPGSLLLADAVSGRFVTADYTATHRTATDWQDCYGSDQRGIFDYQSNDCAVITRTFKLSDVAGTQVSLRQTFTPPSQNIGGVQIADDRVYVSRFARYDYSTAVYGTDGNYTAPKLLEDGGLWALGGIRAGNLSIVSQLTGDAQWPLAASGTKVALYTTGGLAIYDTATPVPTLLSETDLRNWGYTSDVLLGDHRAVASLGEYGLQTIGY